MPITLNDLIIKEIDVDDRELKNLREFTGAPCDDALLYAPRRALNCQLTCSKQIKSVNTVLIKHNCLLTIIAFLVIQLKNNSAE